MNDTDNAICRDVARYVSAARNGNGITILTVAARNGYAIVILAVP